MPIDYEAEYNNRARVPEHPEIFARWARAGEDYRAEAMKERRAGLGLSYGSSLRQFIDLFSPRPGVVAPLALFIHGGYWRSLDQPHGARAQCPRSGGRGRRLRSLPGGRHRRDHRSDPARMSVPVAAHGSAHDDLGHSAGGHLAGAMVATDWQALYPKAPPDLVPAAYSIS